VDTPEKAGWFGIVASIAVPLWLWLKPIVSRRIKRHYDLADVELATRREETARWHQQREDLIVDLRRQVAERDARIVELTDRLFETQRQSDKDADRFAQAVTILQRQLRESSHPPVNSGTTPPRSVVDERLPTVPSLKPPQPPSTKS
jgi:hypothetical protein